MTSRFAIRDAKEDDLPEIRKLVLTNMVDKSNCLQAFYLYALRSPRIQAIYTALGCCTAALLGESVTCTISVWAILNLITWLTIRMKWMSGSAAEMTPELMNWNLFSETYGGEKTKFLVAVSCRSGGEKVIGCVGLRRPDSEMLRNVMKKHAIDQRAVQIQRMSVAKEARGSGVAQSLMREAESHHLRGCQRSDDGDNIPPPFVLFCSSAHRPAQTFYVKEKYRVADELRFPMSFAFASLVGLCAIVRFHVKNFDSSERMPPVRK